MRIGCLFLAHFAVQVEVRENRLLKGKPIIIGGFPYELKAVHDASEEATRQGIKKGMPLRQAYALCPQGIFLPVAEDKYKDAFRHVVNLLGNHSPMIAVGAENCIFLETTLERDEVGFVREVVASIRKKAGFWASTGIASNKFVAWVASQVAKQDEPLVIPDGREREFLQNLPVDLLPASPELLRRLRLFGIYKMGELAELPYGAVNIQFGREGQTLWELANGIDCLKPVPYKMPESLAKEVSFEPPAEDIQVILNRASDILRELAGQLKQRWQCCRCLTVRFSFSNRHVGQRTFHFKKPTCSEEAMLRQLQRWLDGVRFISPVEEMGLSLAAFCSEQGDQASFLDRRIKHRGKLMVAINELQQKYGQGVVKRVLCKEGYLPEDSFSWAELDVKGK